MNGNEVVGTTAEPAFAVDRDGRILAWNDAAADCLGYHRKEAVGSYCWELLQGRDVALNRYCNASCPLREMALRGERIHRTEMYFQSAAGELERVSLTLLVVYGPEGPEVISCFRPLPAPVADLNPGRVAVAGGKPNALLTPRQLEVLEHLAEGETTAEIAEFLCISQVTVRHHVQAVLHRLRVHNRLSAVSLALRIGLL